MTLNSELAKLESNLSDCYTSCNNKGATIPQNQNFDNLSTCIDSITTGGGGGNNYMIPPEIYEGEISPLGEFIPLQSLTYSGNISFDNIGMITDNSFNSTFSRQLTGTARQRLSVRMIYGNISFPDLVSIDASTFTSFSYFAAGQEHIESVSFPELTTISAASGAGILHFTSAFDGCSALTSILFPKLQDITNTRIGTYMLRGCTSLSNLYFPRITASSLGSFTSNMLSNVTGCTVHLPSNLDGQVTPNLGGTNTVYIYDL